MLLQIIQYNTFTRQNSSTRQFPKFRRGTALCQASSVVAFILVYRPNRTLVVYEPHHIDRNVTGMPLLVSAVHWESWMSVSRALFLLVAACVLLLLDFHSVFSVVLTLCDTFMEVISESMGSRGWYGCCV